MDEWEAFLRGEGGTVVAEEARVEFQAAEPKNFCEIPLRNKLKQIVAWAKCSPEHYEELNKYRWYRDKNGYVRTNWNKTSITMHQYLKQNNLPKNHVIDHINSDRLDNTISNLRYATVHQNTLNKKRKSTYSSIYRGVTKNKRGSFTVFGNWNGKSTNLGSTKSEIEAAEIYDRWSLSCSDFEEGFRILNFPNKIEFYKQNPYVKQLNQTSSKYVGVHRRNKKFVAIVNVEKQKFKVCYSESEFECAKAYDKYVYDNKIDKKLNFPDDFPDHMNRVNKRVKTNMKLVNLDTVELILSTNKFQKQMLIDLDDYEKVKLNSVNIDKDGYAKISVDNKSWMLHRYLLQVTDPTIFVDHIDSNPGNCKKNNLRLVTALENSRNRKKRKHATSSFYGVNIASNKRSYTGKVKILKDSYDKTFTVEEYAARWRDLKIFEKAPNSTYKMNFVWTEAEIEEWKAKLNFQ